MFNSKDIQKELERNHEIVLSDTSIITKLKERDIHNQLQLNHSNFQKLRWKPEKNERMSPVF